MALTTAMMAQSRHQNICATMLLNNEIWVLLSVRCVFFLLSLHIFHCYRMAHCNSLARSRYTIIAECYMLRKLDGISREMYLSQMTIRTHRSCFIKKASPKANINCNIKCCSTATKTTTSITRITSITMKTHHHCNVLVLLLLVLLDPLFILLSPSFSLTHSLCLSLSLFFLFFFDTRTKAKLFVFAKRIQMLFMLVTVPFFYHQEIYLTDEWYSPTFSY